MHVCEDVFGGFNATLRNGKVKFKEVSHGLVMG